MEKKNSREINVQKILQSQCEAFLINFFCVVSNFCCKSLCKIFAILEIPIN